MRLEEILNFMDCWPYSWSLMIVLDLFDVI